MARPRKPRLVVSRQILEDHLAAAAWHDPAFRRRLLRSPRAVIQAELRRLTGRPVTLPRGLKFSIHEESPNDIHLVLPAARDRFGTAETDLRVGWRGTLRPRR